ncbi:MAG TPA: CRISPR system precrRNA processing endoribonuclease RAMP protein Cas6 [Thermodesulfobacteriota bacterium]|nr:CRISPR system precrRNA processing endoribonuclease RAMP protein Cas6 [Thermodesulfobacteriota bacterium]
MGIPLSYFKLARCQFVVRAEDWIHLPAYKGSTFRGAFGHAFKKIVCVNREKVCRSCLLREKCIYSYVFETPPRSDTSKMRKYPFAPHPFVITPPLEEKRIYKQNDTLCFELTLIGKSIDFLPYFIYTFDELGWMGIGKGKGKYRLEEVRTFAIDESSKVKGERKETQRDEEPRTIYSGKDKTLKNNFRVLKFDDLAPPNHLTSTLDLRFMTPTRLKFDGNLSPKPEFHILIRNLLRRISLLSYFHCGEELDLDFKNLIEKAKDVRVQKEDLRWSDWERYSNRQETKMRMDGFIGSIRFEGSFEPFIPFLLLGEYVHVGKGTSFGLGNMKS